MASIYDFFSNRAGQMQGVARPDETEEERRRRLLAITRVGNLAGAPISAEPTPLGTTVDRPRLMGPRVPYASAPVAPVTYTGVPDTQAAPLTRQQLLEAQRAKTADLMDLEGNPVENNDRGWKGRLLDIVRESIIAAGDQYNRTGDLNAAIGGGIAGAFGGGFRPTMDEERQRLQDIRRSQYEEQRLGGQIEQDAQTRYREAQINQLEQAPINKAAEIEAENRRTEAMTQKAIMEMQGKSLEEQKQMVFDTWKNLTVFRRDDPKSAALLKKAQELGIDHLLVDKDPAVDKPVTVNQSDINDTLFSELGLMSDEDIRAQARSEMEPSVQGALKFSDEAERYLRNVQDFDKDNNAWTLRYVNADGSLNEPTIAQDLSVGVLQLPQGVRLYENEREARNAQAKIAKRELALRNKQAGLRRDIDRLKLGLKGRDRGSAMEAISLFNEAVKKKNQKALDALFATLGIR